MTSYVNLTLELGKRALRPLDLRVPRELLLKEMLQIVDEAHGLGLDLTNPVCRDVQTGRVLMSTQQLSAVKNGALLRLEEKGGEHVTSTYGMVSRRN